MDHHLLTLHFEGEDVTVEIITSHHDLQYKVNFEHPIYLKKDIDAEGVEFWTEEGVGQTLRAKELGEEIEKHPDFI